MARRRRERRKEIIPDIKFGDPLVTKFVNTMMWDGKKNTSERIFYGALDIVEQRSGKKGIDVFREAMSNVRPNLEVRSRRVGGANYQVPTEVRPVRRDTLAIRWLVNYARQRGERNMKERLANELLDASQQRGGAVKKREDTYKMAEANRAFAHYRW